MTRIVLLGCVLLLAKAAIAQQVPHLAYAYPAGGRVGTTFQVAVGGQFLLTTSNAFVTGTGVTAAVLESSRPMNQKEFNELRDRLKALREKFQSARNGNSGTNVWTASDATEEETIRAKILKNPPNRSVTPAMMDTVILRVSVATNAAPGEREIRLVTPNALSNPIKFCVGDLPELTNPAAKPANPDLAKFLERLGGKAVPGGTPKYETRITVPATVNGQIMPGGVDRYRFAAIRGRQLIMEASARRLIPYLADAVPGWFECVLTVYDSKGKALASARRFHFKPDPVLCFEAPQDGEYTVEVHDSLFRGRQDFIYRLTIGELPFVTSIFPLGGKSGEKTTVGLAGWNLKGSTLTLDHSGTEPGVVSVTGPFFNNVPFAIDDLPECSEHEPNNSAETAQEVTLPVVINGRIARPGEQDVFKFEAHAGEKVVAEVFARRLDSPLDSFLRLTDAKGTQLAFNDDFEDKGSGLNTHHADSYLTATLPAPGAYFLHLTDTQSQGGPEFAYRLRISEPQPDFQLRVVPSSLSLRPGMSAPLTVLALRRDGCTNAINLTLENAPAGFALSGARIGVNQDKAQFTLRAPPTPTEVPVTFLIEGHALICGKRITHVAAPAEDMMQAFFYRHLVPSQELVVAVIGPQRPFQPDAFKIMGMTPVRIPAGGNARVRVSTPTGAFFERFQLELEDAPEGIALENVLPVAGGVELVISCDSRKASPGASGNLICQVKPKQREPGGQPKKTGNSPRRPSLAWLPAIPFSIIEP